MTGEAPQTVEDEVRRRIEADGPMPFEAYMAACLGAEEAGYYQTRDPFGEAGDFVTAPEISGMFGEMCGLTWRICMNSPASPPMPSWPSSAPAAAR